MRKIYTESPDQEQWRILLTYIYRKNIERFFQNNYTSNNYTDTLIESIIGSITQSKEYFDASKNSTLNISPLLLYYGVSNLFFGIINMKECQFNYISDHGMKIFIPDKENFRLGDIEITPCNPESGALSVYNRLFNGNSDLCNTGKWTLVELFGSIPDLYDDFVACYDYESPYLIPVEILKDGKSRTERIKNADLNMFDEKSNIFNRIKNFNENYLNPQMNDGSEFCIINRKVQGVDIGIYGLFGRKYLSLSHLVNGQKRNYPIETYMFMALFALSYISRYKPEYWSPFLRTDMTGEKLLVEKFLSVCSRRIPNYAINVLRNEDLVFVNEVQGTIDKTLEELKNEILESTSEEIRKTLYNERVR